MSFLQSLFLAGLAAAAIPVLIHLLNRPRARVIRFSSLEFVKRLQIRKSKRLRIREILLLILRVLLIALLAFAFARPALRGTLARGLGGTVRTSACVVLDVSYSMGFQDRGTGLFERAKERARSVVGLMKDGDESLLVLGSRSPESRFETPTHNFRLLEGEIERAPLSARGTDLALSVREAMRLLEGSRNPNREIYVVSDMQAGGFQTGSADWEEEAVQDIRLYLLPVGGSARPNLAVTGAELYEPRRFGEAVRIRAMVTNYSEREVDMIATLLLDGERRGTASVTLAAGASGAALFSVPLQEGGVRRGEIRIEDDALPGDNAFFFTLDRPDHLKVLLVGDPGDRGGFYLRKVLGPEEGEGLITIHSVQPPEVRSLRLSGYHAVILAGVPTLDQSGLAALEEYVRGGGGVIVLPGDGLDFGAYNREILPRLFGGGEIGESIIEHRSRPVGVEWHDMNHPVFAIFPRGADRVFQDIHISRLLDLTPPPIATEMARTSDGRTFLFESRLGAGRALMFAVGSDLSWSDLPTQAVFLPLVHELVRYLYSGGALYRQSLTVGKPYRRDLAGVGLGDLFTCTTPSGEVVGLQPRIDGERMVLEFLDTARPGFYLVEGGEFSEWFAVNLNTEESNLTPMGSDRIVEEFGFPGAVLVSGEGRLDRPVMSARFGRELWWEIILLALALAIVELFVAQGSRRTLTVEG